MELYQLRSFAAIAELGHLTRAAERLHVSQPAVSAQIKALEDELGVALFDRVSSGMVLTAAGRRLLPTAEKVLDAAQALRSQARSLQGQVVGRVRVGTVSDPEFTRVGAFLAHALDAYPLLEIEIHHEVSGEAFDKVRDGELDASFYYGNREHPDVVAVPIVNFAYRIVAPAAWGDRIRHASWEELVQMPWIVSPPISTLRIQLDELFAARGSAPTSRIEADNEAVMRSLAVAGAGVTVMREDIALAAAAAGEVALWNRARLATTLKFLHLAQRASDPEIQALLTVLQRTWLSPVAANEDAVGRRTPAPSTHEPLAAQR
ncbi:MAG: LysR family transcriptional regulator [Burkholderiales bacterium]|nr:LysR family transcriptional regulator [Burkholderiales bacterium]